jgi:hypothetical protein
MRYTGAATAAGPPQGQSAARAPERRKGGPTRTVSTASAAMPPSASAPRRIRARSTRAPNSTARARAVAWAATMRAIAGEVSRLARASTALTSRAPSDGSRSSR